ncbi:MAG: ASKHA domain-containing protein [Desulfohalobiaceae bacterium]
MPEIKIQPIGICIEADPQDSLRDALQKGGIQLESPCNGQGVCGSCRVWVLEPWVEETPHETITESEAQAGCRLSCRLPADRDMTIRLPMDFIHDSKRLRESQSILEGDLAPTSRLVSAVKISNRQDQLLLLYDSLQEHFVLNTWHSSFQPKGLAIDLGTTTVVVTLISLKNGRELATASRLNPQIRFGHDVMTRIQHGSSPEGLQDLAGSIREGLNELIEEVCEDSDSQPEEILDLVLGGNTTMLQLLAGIDPAPLGQIPFQVDLQTGISYPVANMGLHTNPAARVYVPPVLHAFIGSDISAGLLVHGDFFQNDKNVLFVDVGTNGEIALNAKGRRLACSTAAGPAFEGMGISCGMRASIGAVESVRYDQNQGLIISTVGNAPAKGICGSGLVDLLSVLLRSGALDTTGRFRNPPPGEIPESIRLRLQKQAGEPCFMLGDNAAFTQRDVRQVQLAKGAVRAGIDILLQEAGCSIQDLDSIYIAGGFGFFLDAANLESIGLLPPVSQDRVVFAGNSCRSGCVWLLTDISYRRFLEENTQHIEHISIAQSPKFMELYAESMEF